MFFAIICARITPVSQKKRVEMITFLWQNLRNEEQVTVIQAGTVLSLCEKVSSPSFSKSSKIRLLIFCQWFYCIMSLWPVAEADRQHRGSPDTENDWSGEWKGQNIHVIWDECVVLFVLTAGLVIDEAWWHLIKNVSYVCSPVLTVVNWCYQQELFSKQKGFLEEELDYRKQALDQSQLVGLWDYVAV